ncbi:hypothetical protein ACLBR5_13390 [Escherichia coli]
MKLTACLAKRVNWRRRYACGVRGEEDFLAFSRAATGRLRDEFRDLPLLINSAVCHYRYLAVESAGGSMSAT